MARQLGAIVKELRAQGQENQRLHFEMTQKIEQASQNGAQAGRQMQQDEAYARALAFDELGGWDDGDVWAAAEKSADRLGASLFGKEEMFGDPGAAGRLVSGLVGAPPAAIAAPPVATPPAPAPAIAAAGAAAVATGSAVGRRREQAVLVFCL